MNLTEQTLIDMLIDLRKNHHVTGVKAEFEDEGATFEEVFLLKMLSAKAGVGLTIKIGGCGAINDLYQAAKLNADTIVAPMIESSYALKKYIQALKCVYGENKKDLPNVYINIETITGYMTLDDILSIEEAKFLTGVVIGKCDMTRSCGLSCDETNSGKIFEIVNDIVIKCLKRGKKLMIGGGVSVNSINFFKRLPENSLDGFETRKIIFDARKSLQNDCREGVLKAIDFEIMWLKYKQEFLTNSKDDDIKRIKTLESRYKALSVQ